MGDVRRCVEGQSRRGAADSRQERAYELYEARGRVDGWDLEDWFEAERELVGKVKSRFCKRGR